MSEEIRLHVAGGELAVEAVSPKVRFEEAEGEKRMIVTDVDGEKSVTLEPGPQGIQGPQGEQGPQGFSPLASVSKTGTAATIAITDAQGATTATVYDGDDYVITSADKQEIAESVVTNVIAPEYDSTDTYAAGEYVTYNGGLYRCRTAIGTAEMWTAAHWQQVTFDREVSDLKSEINAKYGDFQIPLKYGSANTSTGVIILNPSTKNRLVSDITKKGIYKFVVSNDADVRVYVLYYASDLSYVKAVGWESGAYELENYPYIAVLLKIGSAGTETFSTTEIPVYLSEYSSVPSIDALVTAVEDVAEDVTQLTGTVNGLAADVAADEALADAVLYQNTSYINRANQHTDNSLAATKRWFLDLTIPAGTFVADLKFWLQVKRVASALTVELWSVNGGTLTKIKSIPFTDFVAESVNTVAINTYCSLPSMIGLLTTASIVYTANAGVHILKADDTSPSTTTLNLSAVTDFGDFSPNVTVDTIRLKGSSGGGFTLPENVVVVGAGMDYPQIQDALNGITDDSASKPYTILVMPSGTPYQRFSMLRDYSQTYPWNSISPRYVSIIGLDKKHCIIKSDSGNYKLPCGEPMTNGVIKNLTFIMTNDDQDPNATQGGYCLHIDCRTLDDVGYNMLIEDCDFEDASGPCLGIGMHKNCTLTIRRCNFHTSLAANYSPHEGYTNLVNYGVIFCHSSTRADATNQKIIIEDCTGLCEEGNKGLWLSIAGDYDPSTASFYYRLIRNVFWNKTQNAPAYSISGTLTADPMNYGNNIP